MSRTYICTHTSHFNEHAIASHRRQRTKTAPIAIMAFHVSKCSSSRSFNGVEPPTRNAIARDSLFANPGRLTMLADRKERLAATDYIVMATEALIQFTRRLAHAATLGCDGALFLAFLLSYAHAASLSINAVTQVYTNIKKTCSLNIRIDPGKKVRLSGIKAGGGVANMSPRLTLISRCTQRIDEHRASHDRARHWGASSVHSIECAQHRILE